MLHNGVAYHRDVLEDESEVAVYTPKALVRHHPYLFQFSQFGHQNSAVGLMTIFEFLLVGPVVNSVIFLSVGLPVHSLNAVLQKVVYHYF